MAKHTYQFDHDGTTYTRTTHRTYTYAIVLYMTTRDIPGGNGRREPCDAYVADVCYSSSEQGARKAQRAYHSHGIIIRLDQSV